MSITTFVDQLYARFLGRSADPGGKSYWVSQLDSGAQSAAEVTNSFMQSPEFSGVVTPVALLYYAAFSRIPDAGGLSFWTQKYQSGVSLKEISEGFSGSLEFSTKYAGLDNSGFLDQLYQNTFNRVADAGGKAYWLDQMATQGSSRADVLRGFASSAELANAKGADVKIIVEYHGILNTTPTQAQIDAAIALNDYKATINGLYSSTGYVGEAVPGLSAGKTVAGIVVDGYIKGATVFADANGDGIWNPGEATTTTDDKGNFTLAGARGIIIASGGKDLSTGADFKGVMTAPEGATVINPLTTLQQAFVSQGLSVEEAEAKVGKALGIDVSKIDLTKYDPISAAFAPDASVAEKSVAAGIQAQALKLQNFLVAATGVLTGAAGGAEKLTEVQAVKALVDSMASAIANDSDGAVSMASAEFLKVIMTGSVAAAVNADLTAAASRVTAMGDSFSAMLADSAGHIDAIMAKGGDAINSLAQLTQVSSLAQGEMAAKIGAAATAGNLDSLVSSYTGAAADAAAAKLKVVDLNPNSSDDNKAIGEVNSGTPSTPGKGSSGGGGGGAVTPLPQQTKCLDDLGGSSAFRVALAAESAANTYHDDPNVSDFISIAGFGADDVISFTSEAQGLVAFSSKGQDVLITCNKDGIVSSIELKGILTSSALIYDAPSFNALPVGNVTFDGPAYLQTLSLDTRGGTLGQPAAINVINGKFNLIDDSTRASVSSVSGFGSDDTITWQNITASNVSVSNKGSDVTLTANQGGVISTITLTGVATQSDIIFDIASFNALPVGNVLFQ